MDNGISDINSREDFLRFLEALISELNSQDVKWENATLESYLEAMKGWAQDMDGYFEQTNLPAPQNVDWRLFATMLRAASIYE